VKLNCSSKIHRREGKISCRNKTGFVASDPCLSTSMVVFLQIALYHSKVKLSRSYGTVHAKEPVQCEKPTDRLTERRSETHTNTHANTHTHTEHGYSQGLFICLKKLRRKNHRTVYWVYHENEEGYIHVYMRLEHHL